MAPKVTSSAQRSKGKAKKPVTTTKGRANRQSVSTAKVSDSSQRTNTGSAKVTGGQKALPPGRKGGDLKQSGQIVKSSKGTATDGRIYQTSVGEVSKRPKPLSSSSTKALPAGKPGGALMTGGVRANASAAKPSGNFKAPSIPKAASKDLPSPPKPSGMGSMRTGIAGAAASALTDKFLSPMAFKAGQALGKNILKPAGQALDRATGKGTSAAKAKPATTTSRFAGARDREFDRASKIQPTGSTARRASTSGGGSSSGGRTSGGGSSTPSRPAARPAAPAMPSAVTKATPAAAAPKPASKGPNIGPTADGASYGKAVKLQSKIDGTSDNDMKRRRAFLDAKDSMAGAKAVRELQEKRKKKLAGMLSSETTIAPSKQQS